jgi:hypothetical protein
VGDRANVVVKDGEDQVWFYGHWNGESYVSDTKTALSKNWRWDDAPFLARIIFDELTAGSHGHETGFGISCRIGDNEHPILVVDVPGKCVYFVKETALVDGRIPDDCEPEEKQSFEAFISTRDRSIWD